MKSWWPGDARVEPFMNRVREALDRQNLTGDARTDIYNRAYEAVYYAIRQYDQSNIKNVLATPPNKLDENSQLLYSDDEASKAGMWCRMCGGACDLENCGMEEP